HGRDRERHAEVRMGRRQRLHRDRDRADQGRVSFRFALLFACILPAAAGAGEIPLSKRLSGYEMMSRETRSIQDDDATNPGMLWVLDGGTLWAKKSGSTDKSCADCHSDAAKSMKGVAARYPAFDPARGKPLNLEQRVNACRVDRQKAPAFAYE